MEELNAAMMGLGYSVSIVGILIFFFVAGYSLGESNGVKNYKQELKKKAKRR